MEKKIDKKNIREQYLSWLESIVYKLINTDEKIF